jgi:hypothetical protein
MTRASRGGGWGFTSSYFLLRRKRCNVIWQIRKNIPREPAARTSPRKWRQAFTRKTVAYVYRILQYYIAERKILNNSLSNLAMRKWTGTPVMKWTSKLHQVLPNIIHNHHKILLPNLDQILTESLWRCYELFSTKLVIWYNFVYGLVMGLNYCILYNHVLN